MATDIQVYGTDWCRLTFDVREYLMNRRLAHEFHDIDRDRQALDLVLALTDGRRRFPVVTIRERVLTNPTRLDLQRVLEDYGIRPENSRRGRPIAPVSTPSRSRRR